MSKRILVVEDQPDNRQIIRDLLTPYRLSDYRSREWRGGTGRRVRNVSSGFHPTLDCPPRILERPRRTGISSNGAGDQGQPAEFRFPLLVEQETSDLRRLSKMTDAVEKVGD